MSGESTPKKEEIEEDYQLPPRDAGPSFRGASDTTVLANLFTISIDDGRPIFKYRIDIRKIIASKDKELDLSKGPKNDYATQARRRVLQSLWYDLIKFNEKKGAPIVTDKYSSIYDCGNIIYSSTPLLCFEGKGDAKEIQFKMTLDDVSSDNSKRFLGTACSEIVFILTPTISFDFSLTGDLARESQQFLEILTSARLVKDADHFVFKNKLYGKTSRNEVSLDKGKVIKPGFEKNCRIGDVDGRAVALLQIDAKKSPFFVGSKVTDFALKFLNKRDTRDLEGLRGKDIPALSNQLKGLVVRTTHTEKGKARTFAVHSVSNQSANDIKFEHDGNQITMTEYFSSRYNTPIKYPNIPVIADRGPRGISYFPMEFLEIERGQRVTNQKATPDLAEKQITECRMAPMEMRNYVEKAMKECLLGSDNPFLKAFGVRVESQWQRASATVLHPPKIVYSNSSVECGRDGFLNWKLGREQFVRGGKITKFMFIVFDKCANDQGVDAFIRAIVNTARKFGVKLDEGGIRVEECRSESEAQLEKHFDYMKKENFPFIMALTKFNNDPIHDTLKAMEARTGVVTQHIAQKTFQKAIGPKGAFMVLNNLVLKMNLKAQGINHSLELSRPFMEANKGTDAQDANKRLLPKFRMFIGLDVSHAGPQSFSDRQLGTSSSEPSVVGMSYTMAGPTEMKGTYWLQEPRLATISQLEVQMARALDEYLKKMGRLPDDIIIYRGGVSEGEYAKVVQEVQDMKKGFAHVKGGDRFNPTMQCIIVQTNSNFRVIPERAEGRDGNVRPGTVVDHVITNPNHSEFVLVAQKGIMGTVRPIKCVIAYTSPGSTGTLLSLEDTKLLTNLLCYGHQVVAGCTTLPCLLTAATNLSKRGRNNWKTVNFHNADARSEISGGSGSGGAYRNDGSKDFFTELSKVVQAKNNHHYWA